MSYTPKALPNNPTALGWNANKIRQYQYKGFEILFDYYEDMYDSFNINIESLNSCLNELYNDIGNEKDERYKVDTELKEFIDSNKLELENSISTTNNTLADFRELYDAFQASAEKTFANHKANIVSNSTNISINTSDISAIKAQCTTFTTYFNNVSDILNDLKNGLDLKLDRNSILDTSGIILPNLLPSYVDDVLEYNTKSDFPLSGETGKIYVDKAKNLTYRWSGSIYVEISPSLALGETDETAWSGAKGLTNKNNITKLDTRVTSLENRTTSVENKTTTNTSDISTLKTNVSTNEKSISTLNATTNNLSGKIATNEKSISTNKTDIVNLKTDLAKFKAIDEDTSYFIHLVASSDGLSLIFEN